MQRSSGLCPCGVGWTLDGLKVKTLLSGPACVSDHGVGTKKVLVWGMAGPHLSWPFGVAATKHHKTRRLVGKDATSQGLRLGASKFRLPLTPPCRARL